MKWFRVYSEARTDAKLESLTDAQHRVWFRLMCFAGDQDERGFIRGYDLDLLAVEVARGDVELLTATLDRLVKLRIIATGDDDVQFVNWEKRQYDKPSDAPEQTRQRKRKSRASSIEEQPVTPMSRDVTPHRAETDSETETDSEELSAEADVAAPEPIEMTDAERKVAGYVRAVKGMATVPEEAIVLHLREIITNRGSPVSEAAIVSDAMTFRDHWTDKRSNQKPDERWRGWRAAMSRWFTNTREPTAIRPAINGNRRQDNVATGNQNFDIVRDIVVRRPTG